MLHDRTEQRYGIAHGFRTLVACLHDRDAVGLAARPDLHKRIEDSMPLADLIKLSDGLVELALDPRRICRGNHAQRRIFLVLPLCLVRVHSGHDLP